MAAGRFQVYCSAYYGQQVQPVCMPVTRLDSPAQALKRARQEVCHNPGSVAVILGPGTKLTVGPDGQLQSAHFQVS